MLGKSTKILSPCRHGQQVSVSDSFDVGLVNKIEVAPKDAVIAQWEPEVSSLGSAYKLQPAQITGQRQLTRVLESSVCSLLSALPKWKCAKGQL